MSDKSNTEATSPESQKTWEPITKRGNLNTDLVDAKTLETMADLHLEETATMDQEEERREVQERERMRREHKREEQEEREKEERRRFRRR